MQARVLLLIGLSAGLMLGCIERTSYETANDSDRVAKLLLKKPPAKLDKRLDADLDGKVVLLGYDLDRDEVAAGGQFVVTWYWQVVQAPGAGWRLFTHVLDGKGRSRVNRDKVGPIRQSYQPEHWQPGTVIKDPQKIKVPAKWKTNALELRVGLWKGQDRMAVKGGPVDGSNRVKGPRLTIGKGGAPAVEEAADSKIPRAAAKPKIDGEHAGEAAWEGALELGAFLQTLNGDPVSRTTAVKLMWDDEGLYVAMSAKDDHLQSKYTNHDDELWHEDAFEVFLDPRGDKKHYYEIQVSPAGVMFDSYLPAYRKNRNEWSSAARFEVKREGTLNDDSDDDRGWSAELMLPFASMEQGGGVPPAAGDRWRANFFRVDVTKKKPVYSAWSPPLRGDFHALDRFGTLTFDAPAPPPATKGTAKSDAGTKDGGTWAPGGEAKP